MHRQFDTQVAARDHDAVGDRQDLIEVVDRRGLLDLRHDGGAASGQITRLLNVSGTLHEGQSEPIHTQCADELQVAAILLGQGCQGQDDVWHVDAFAVRDRSTRLNRAIGMVIGAFRHPQPDLAIVDQQVCAGLKRRKDLLVGQLHPRGIARRRVKIEAKGLPPFQFHRAIAKDPDTQLGPLQVGQNRDGVVQVFFNLADDAMAGLDVFMCAMRHVQPEHIGARFVQGTDHFIGGRGGAQCGHDFCTAVAFHCRLPCMCARGTLPASLFAPVSCAPGAGASHALSLKPSCSANDLAVTANTRLIAHFLSARNAHMCSGVEVTRP